MRSDLITASLVAVLALTGLMLSFDHYSQGGRPPVTILDNIPQQRAKFSVEVNDKQIGKAESWFDAFDSGLKRFYGALSINTKKSEQQSFTAVRAEFNPLGQLTLLDIGITVFDQQITIMAFQTAPIILQVHIARRPQLFSQPILLPGPLTLTDLGNGHGYSLRYAPFSGDGEEAQALEQTLQIIKMSGVRFKPIAEVDATGNGQEAVNK